MNVERPAIPREREGEGRERWLSREELARFQAERPREWWPYFAVKFYRGALDGEVRALHDADVLLHVRRFTIHEEHHRVKSASAVRHLPIPEALDTALGAHLAQRAPGPYDLVFPGDPQDHNRVTRAWRRICRAAGIAGATPHDARHTFGVHAAQAGIPIVRLQRLLGHATPAMTMRYMQHAPEAHLDQDGAAIAAHMTAVSDPEAEARAAAARRGMLSA